jgi:membrane protein DedA with SNARE-associated domain
MPELDRKNNNRYLLLKYAGLALQWVSLIFISVFLGNKLDFWLKLTIPISSIILPVLTVLGMLIQIIRDTHSNKK